MSLPFTSVVSYHTNEHGCGVAKFSKQLAERLGVPFRGIDDGEHGTFPLFSLKWSEMSERKVWGASATRYGVFWHDAGEPYVTSGAEIVYYGDPSLGSPGLWCPSLMQDAPPRPVKLFTFGMAGRLQAHAFRRVRELLEAASIRYHLRVSVGIHEGTSLHTAFHHFDALKEIMGPEHVTILGILSDEAVQEELRNCDYVLAFFEKGLRANNTTVHAALAADKTVISNHDAQTPGYLKVCTRDIVTRTEWGKAAVYQYSWDNLLAEMERIYETAQNRQHSRL